MIELLVLAFFIGFLLGVCIRYFNRTDNMMDELERYINPRNPRGAMLTPDGWEVYHRLEAGWTNLDLGVDDTMALMVHTIGLAEKISPGDGA